MLKYIVMEANGIRVPLIYWIVTAVVALLPLIGAILTCNGHGLCAAVHAFFSAESGTGISSFRLAFRRRLWYNQGGRGKAPVSPLRALGRRLMEGAADLFYSFMMRFTLSRSSSSVLHFSQSDY